MKNRILLRRLKEKIASRHGRLVVLSGARQTGKTTLVRQLEGYDYISLDDPILRPQYTRLSAVQWRERFQNVILDEVQKAPALFESVKAAFDAHADMRFILTGSSQILMLRQVRESMAGRAALFELFPLTIPEMRTASWSEDIPVSRFQRWIAGGPKDTALFLGIPAGDKGYAQAQLLFERYLSFGALPEVLAEDLGEKEKRDWLHQYVQTYLQRDLRDLVAIRDLEPFVLAQRCLAELVGQQVHHSTLAREAGIAPQTAKRFLSYLEISYQVIVLRPWFRNRLKRLVKTPKLHWLDPGVQQAVAGRSGDLTGFEYEGAVVAEIYKQARSLDLRIQFHHLRTSDGLEVDLLLELENGFVPIEIKKANRVSPGDAKHLFRLREILDKPVLGAFVLSNDPEVRDLGEGILALPAPWFLG